MYWQTWFGLQGEPKTDVMLLRLLFRLCVKVKKRYSVKLEYFCFHSRSPRVLMLFLFAFSLVGLFSSNWTQRKRLFFPIPGCFTFIQSKDATFNSLYLSLQKTTALYELPMLEVTAVRAWVDVNVHSCKTQTATDLSSSPGSTFLSPKHHLLPLKMY